MMKRVVAALLAATALAACASAPAAAAQTPPPGGMPPMSSIQPETTISLNGKGSVDRAPDIAMITVGVSVEAATASAAMADQTAKMNGVFNAVKAAGIADRDMQTSNLSLNAVYDYPPNQQPKMRGYNASNQITIKVRDLKNLGKTLDAVVKGGGNTIHGIAFSVDKPEAYQNEARVAAIKDAAAKAELYAQAVGYKVKRIVTVTEIDYSPRPPMPYMSRMQVQDAAESTPIAAGEVSLEQQVSVVFELAR
jgi:uncharacterized protein YggE